MSSEAESPTAALAYATERILRPRRPTYGFRIIWISVVFIGMGVYVLPGVPLLGLLAIAIGGTFASFPLVNFLPGVTFLRLGTEGFTVHGLHHTQTYLWESVGPFIVEAVRSTDGYPETVVSFTSAVDPAMKAKTRAERRRIPKNGGVIRKPPFRITLWADTYDLTPVALAAIMNEWRDWYGGPSRGRPLPKHPARP